MVIICLRGKLCYRGRIAWSARAACVFATRLSSLPGWSSNFRCSPPLLATACASLTARCAQAMTVKVNVSKEPSRRSRIANPAACVFCVLTMVVVVPNLWA